MSKPRSLAAMLLVATMVAVAGCVSENRPETCDDESVTIEVTVRADGMTPTDPSVCLGQEVTLAVSPEVDGVFHIHGLDQSVPATTIAQGQPIELAFTTDRTGQFPIELHPAADPQGIHIGILTIHER
jgi:hypothetical protein